jgi:1-acyl-sn-glycerol-3-phosphate acyltransferase
LLGEDAVLTPRWRLVLLWISQTARALADWCLRMFVVLRLAAAGQAESDTAWHVATAVFIAPFILFAPFNGALSNSLPKRWALVGACGFSLAVMLGFVSTSLRVEPGGPWLIGLALVATSTAVYSPSRYALLPAASRDTGIPLSRINGWIEMGGSAAIVIAVAVALELEGILWLGLPGAVVLAAAASLVALLAALPARFPSDAWRPEPPLPAIVDFFKDCRRVALDPEARGTLLGLAGFMGLVIAGSGAVVAQVLNDETAGGGMNRAQNIILVGIGVALGSFLASLQGHPRRSLGLIPFAALGLLAALAWAALSSDRRGASLMMGVMAGLANVPLRAAYQAALPADARGNGLAVSNTANYVVTVALALVLLGLVHLHILPTPSWQLLFLALLSAAGVVAAGWFLHREGLELIAEFVVWPMYDIRGHGPGLAKIPSRGPLLILANHSAWGDPFWVSKVIPRRIIPLMTSLFYDKPVLHWLMTRVVHAIRVPAVSFRREAPELQDAIAALDRGDAVLIFPEGMIRRKEEDLIHPFGQGIWRILRHRPHTPVVVCWIEGGWKSYTSYFNGPPTVNKRPDWRRRIDVVVTEPRVLDAALLNDQRATRTYLMKECVDTRRLLGLETPAKLPTTPEEPAMAGDDNI